MSSLRPRFSVEPYRLQLRAAFGTSHSTTTERTNALITLRIVDGTGVSDNDNDSVAAVVVGYGEVGLPPRKPRVYDSDYADVAADVQRLVHALEATSADALDTAYDPFASLESTFFAGVRTEPCASDDAATARAERCLRGAFAVADRLSPPLCRAAASGVECALLDAWAKLRRCYLYELLGVGAPVQKPCWYTAGLDALDAMERSARGGLALTSRLKIKLDGDVPRGEAILHRLVAVCTEVAGPTDWRISVDANASWSADVALRYLPVLAPLARSGHLLMVEQPFPVDAFDDAGSAQRWERVRSAYDAAAVPIFADESVRVAADVPLLARFAGGVNLKLEKTGGFREALRAFTAAHAHGLRVWIGSMVSSQLACSAAAHLLALSDYGGDLDGALLTTEQSQRFRGGMELVPPRGDVRFPPVGSAEHVAFGVGVQPK